MTLPQACDDGIDSAFDSGICCLMLFLRPCLVEVRHIGIEDALKLLLMQDEQVIEALTSHTAQEALTDVIGAWSVIRVLRISMPLVLATRAKPTPNLLSLSRMRYFGPIPKAWLPEAVVPSKRRPILAGGYHK